MRKPILACIFFFAVYSMVAWVCYACGYKRLLEPMWLWWVECALAYVVLLAIKRSYNKEVYNLIRLTYRVKNQIRHYQNEYRKMKNEHG